MTALQIARSSRCSRRKTSALAYAGAGRVGGAALISVVVITHVFASTIPNLLAGLEAIK
jgi:hypothetical protein